MQFFPGNSVGMSIKLRDTELFISRSLISQSGKNQIPLEMCFMILNFIIYSSLKKTCLG